MICYLFKYLLFFFIKEWSEKPGFLCSHLNKLLPKGNEMSTAKSLFVFHLFFVVFNLPYSDTVTQSNHFNTRVNIKYGAIFLFLFEIPISLCSIGLVLQYS